MEKVEEKIGCEFCRGEYELEIGDCNLTIEYVPVLSNGLMKIESCLKVYINEHGENGSKNHYELMQIKYCPACGRKL